MIEEIKKQPQEAGLKPAVSFVIPCYNEEKRLEPGLSEALTFIISRLGPAVEIVFVDDGSTDQTRQILQMSRQKFPSLLIEIISYTPNRGKGYAVKTGVLAAQGEKIVVTDADFSIDLEDALEFIRQLDFFDIVVGTKKHAATQSLKRQAWPRRFLGKGFTVLTNLMLNINFSDITCGLKAFRREAARDIFAQQRLERWSYDAETLYLASRRGYKILELPVRWRHVEASKVRPLRDTLRSFKELVSLRLRK